VALGKYKHDNGNVDVRLCLAFLVLEIFSQKKMNMRIKAVIRSHVNMVIILIMGTVLFTQNAAKLFS
jgi:hypothetical protein